jgi:hypothetical protein
MLSKNTTGRAFVTVNVEEGKVTEIVILTRTVIEKPWMQWTQNQCVQWITKISSFFVISSKVHWEGAHARFFILYFRIAFVCEWLFCTIKLGLELGIILKNPLIIRYCWTVWRLRTGRQHPIPQKGLVKAQKSWRLFFLSPFSLQLIWTLTRTKEEWTRQPITEMITMDTCKVLIPLSAGNNEEGDNLSFAFFGQI